MTDTPGAPTPTAAQDLPTHFDFATAERALGEAWDRAGIFHADPARTTRARGDRDPFTILIPPPNVTAVLHVGHGLNNTVQDVLARWRRMAGDETLWLPGTDHAGIATQLMVERELAREGTCRAALGRERFLERMWAWKEKYQDNIRQQLEMLMEVCDRELVRLNDLRSHHQGDSGALIPWLDHEIAEVQARRDWFLNLSDSV